MRILKLAVCLLILATVIVKASPQDDARFLQNVREAFSKKDKTALVGLYCWDGVSQQNKEMFQVVMSDYFDRDMKAVEFETFDTSKGQNRTNGSTVFIPNLAIVKKIGIDYTNPPNSGTKTLKLFAGEKDGKLMLIQWIPKP